jgi:ABC-type nitrate/sulfonate/bicarbonate transport system permease component
MSMSVRTRAVLLGAAGLVVFVAVWSAITLASPDIFFPTPAAIVARAFEFWTSGEGLHNLRSSLGNLFAGLGLAVLIGVVLGLLIGSSRVLSLAFGPLIEFARAIPSTALIPFALLLLGLGDDMKIFLITFGTLWPILLNTVDGMRSIDPTLRDTASVYQIRGRARVTRVILPAVAPRIATGIRIAIPISLILVVTSELVGSSVGIGFVIVDAQATFRLLDMWSGILLLGVLGFLISWLFGLLERRLLRWAPTVVNNP